MWDFICENRKVDLVDVFWFFYFSFYCPFRGFFPFLPNIEVCACLYYALEMDEEDCERRRMECLDEMSNLEKQFTDLKEQ